MFWAARVLHWSNEWVFLPGLRGSGNILKLHRDGDRPLQLLVFNEEFLVSACHQLMLTTSQSFVHTTCRFYQLNDLVKYSDCVDDGGLPPLTSWEFHWTLSFRGRRSHNKVTVGELAVGSLITGVFFFGSGWLGFDCNVGMCGVSLGGRVWCLVGTLLVTCLKVMLIFSCVIASHTCACPTHPLFFFPPMCFCRRFGSLFLGSQSDNLFDRAWLSQLRCLGNMMDKFRLICSGDARSFVHWKS